MKKAVSLSKLIATLLLLPGLGQAAPAAFTDPVTFGAAAGATFTHGFDFFAPGYVIQSGIPVVGLTFLYDLDGVELIVTDGTMSGGAGPFDTTSGANSIGTNDEDVILDGDTFFVSFAPISAFGMFFITADAMLDDDITLSGGGTTASLATADLIATLADGAEVYFLGLVDNVDDFSSVQIESIGGGFFVYNVDDILVPAPEPQSPALLALALFLSTAPLLDRLRRRG